MVCHNIQGVAVSSQHAPLWGKGEPSIHRESVFAILHSGACPPTQNSLLRFGPRTFRNYFGQEEGVDFFLQWRILSSWTMLGISPNLITRGYMQCGRPGAAVKDLSLQGGPVFRIPYPLLLTSVNWDKFPDFSEPLYPQLWDENPNDKGTGLKMLPRGTVWSLFSLIPKGPKLEYYFSIFGIHIIITLGSIFLIQNSTLYDHSLPVHQICLGGHRVGCGTLTARQGFLLLRYLHNCHTDIYVGHTCIFKFQQQ